MDGLADIGVDPPPLLHRLNDGGKVVVCEDHLRRSLGHVGAGQPHSAADVRRLEGWGVVDAVPRHGHHPPLLLPGPDDAHLVLRRHPGKDSEFFNVLLQHLLGHEVQLRAGEGQVPWAADVQLPCHRHGRGTVVPGDHHRADARLVAPLHRRPSPPAGAGRPCRTAPER